METNKPKLAHSTIIQTGSISATSILSNGVCVWSDGVKKTFTFKKLALQPIQRLRPRIVMRIKKFLKDWGEGLLMTKQMQSKNGKLLRSRSLFVGQKINNRGFFIAVSIKFSMLIMKKTQGKIIQHCTRVSRIYLEQFQNMIKFFIKFLRKKSCRS